MSGLIFSYFARLFPGQAVRVRVRAMKVRTTMMVRVLMFIVPHIGEDDYDGPMRFKVESKLNVKRLLQVSSTP